MKKSIFLLGIAASLLALSCSKTTPTGDNGIKTAVSLGAVLEQQTPETKTAFVSGGVVWSLNDQLSVLSSENATAGDLFTLQEASAGQTNGVFDGELTTADQYYALYPYAETAALSSTSVTFPVAKTQEYTAGGFANGANASVAPFSEATKNSLTFKNVFGVLKLSLKAASTDITVNSIDVTDNSGKVMNGKATVTLTNITSGDPAATISDGTNTVTINCSTPVTVTSSSATDFYFVVPKGAFANGFTVTVNSTDGYRIVSTTKDNTIKRSYIREMPEVTLPENPETAINLSVAGTANCYVVPAAGEYKFNATVKGNNAAATIAPTKVILIWETDNTATEISANSIVGTPTMSGGYVYFTATGKAGNALIAVTDDSDNILWSWHIWCVADLKTIDGYPGNQGCLDRNVGALSAEPGNPETMGLYYEWGRKDPFFGQAGFSDKTEWFVAGTQMSMSTVVPTISEFFNFLY